MELSLAWTDIVKRLAELPSALTELPITRADIVTGVMNPPIALVDFIKRVIPEPSILQPSRERTTTGERYTVSSGLCFNVYI